MAVAWAVGAWGNNTWLGMNAGPPNAWRGATTPSSAVLTGTVSPSATEAQIVAGGRTIILTLANDTWVAAGASFNAQRQNLINGITAASSPATGWNLVVKALQGIGGVVRTSDTVVTVTLDAETTYEISSAETITATIPASALVTSLIAVVATPTFTITPDAPPPSDIPMGGSGYPVYPSTINWQGKRRKATKADKPNKHLAEILDSVVAEHYGEIVASEAPQSVKAEAGKFVKPFADKKGRFKAVPKPAEVDWKALQQDADAVAAILRIWREEVSAGEIGDDDDELLMLLH